MLKIVQRAQFNTQVAAMFANLRAGMERAVTRMMADGQAHAGAISPVFSGDFASNWNVSYGSSDVTFRVGDVDYFGMGFPEARDSAWGRGNFNMSGFKLGQTAYLTNTATHDEPYAWKIERNQINFRPVNVGKDRVAGKTAEYLTRQYGVITRGMLV